MKKFITLFASVVAVSSRFFLLSLTIILCVSSAKFDKVLFSVQKWRSAIKIMESNGDNLEPWGVPILISYSLDLLQDTSTNCFLLLKYDSIHFIESWQKPYNLNFSINIWCGTESKAADKSYKIIIISLLISFASRRISNRVSNLDIVLGYIGAEFTHLYRPSLC